MCIHTNELKRRSEIEREMPDSLCSFLEAGRVEQSGNGPNNSWILKPKSSSPVPFDLPANLKQVLFESAKCNVDMTDQGFVLIPTIPPEGNYKCRYTVCGFTWKVSANASNELELQHSIDAKLILRKFSLDCTGTVINFKISFQTVNYFNLPFW